MHHTLKVISSTILLLSLSSFVYTQDATLNILKTFQTTYLNPSFQNEHSFEIGVANVAGTLGIDNITIGDVLKKGSNGRYTIQTSEAFELLDERNKVEMNIYAGLIDLKKDFGKIQLTTGLGVKSEFISHYSKDLIGVMANGNADYLGKTIDLSTEGYYHSYNQCYAGLSYDFGKLNLGGRIRYISGIQHLSAPKNTIELTTSDEIYQLRLQTDLELLSSEFLNYNDINDAHININQSLNFDNLFRNNQGLLFDFGMSYDVSDRFKIHGAIHDIGSINWNSSAFIYTSKKIQDFNGIDLSDYFLSDEKQEISLEDTLYNLLDLQKNQLDFTTKAGVDIVTGIDWQASEKWWFSALFTNINNGNLNSSYYTVLSRYRLNDKLHLGANYTLRGKLRSNLGVNIQYKIGKINMHLGTDNLLGAINMLNTHNYSLKGGVSLTIL